MELLVRARDVKAQDIEAAAVRIRPEARVTELLRLVEVDQACACSVALKCEMFQPIGAFKIRGALNALRLLAPEVLKRGVVTESSGNFAQAVAFAAQRLGAPAHIVMPSNAPAIKVAGVKRCGGIIYPCEPSEAGRKQTCREVLERTGGTLTHPFNDVHVIAGQGTVGLEIMQQLPECRTVIVPVGGGGLISGIAVAVKQVNPAVKVIGVEPEGAGELLLSLQKGQISPLPGGGKSVAEGLLSTVGQIPFSIIQKFVDQVVSVTEQEIARTTLWLYERAKLVVEPSGATALAALQHKKLGQLSGPVVVVLSGGNIDSKRFAELELLAR